MGKIYKKEYTDWKGFGARVKNGRESIGLTREKFSEMIDRSENYVLSLEKGDNSCSIHTLHQISKVLNISVDTLLYGETNIKNYYENKEILHNIIDRCSNEKNAILLDIITAIFPNLDKIENERK